jgi:hypothetical protein
MNSHIFQQCPLIGYTSLYARATLQRDQKILNAKKKSGLREFFGTVIKLENSVVLKNNFTQDKFSY